MYKIKFDKNNNRSVAYDNDVEIGKCEFIEVDCSWNIVHTEVNKSYQGKGIARKLVECIIENSKIYNKNVIADCSYAKKIISGN